MRVTHLAIFALAVLIACEPQTPRVGTFSVTDSSGVSIVTNEMPAWGSQSPWVVDSLPIIEIGRDPSEKSGLFTFVQSAVAWDDGSVVVLDLPSYELRFFDPNGVHIVSLGGEGDGPGEFRGPSGLVLNVDTLVVFDRAALTVSRILANGTFLDRRSASAIPMGGEMSGGGWFMALGDASLVAQSFARSRAPSPHEIRRSPVTIALGNLDEHSMVTLGTYPGLAQFSVPDARRDAFLPRYEVVFSPLAGPNGIAIGDTETGTIDLFTSSGAHTTRIRYPNGVRPPPQQDVDQERNASLAWAEARAARSSRFNLEDYRRWLEALPEVQSWPVFRSLLVDPLGYIWALQYRPGEGISVAPDVSQDALVFHPEGYLMGVVVLPPTIDPLYIGRNHIVGRTIDDLDIHRVVTYRLHR
jgi:hypothetical protein